SSSTLGFNLPTHTQPARRITITPKPKSRALQTRAPRPWLCLAQAQDAKKLENLPSGTTLLAQCEHLNFLTAPPPSLQKCPPGLWQGPCRYPTANRCRS